MPAQSLRRRVQAVAVAAVVSVGAVGAVAVAPAADAASPAVVVAEVYGGGGNSGATYTNDYVELFNRSDTAVDVTGWTVGYFSASGSSGGTATLTGSVAARSAYLVQLAAGAGGTTPLPQPDATGSLSLSSSSGRIDLLDAAATPALVDRVGYGSATVAEGAPAPTLSNTTAATRRFPCADTDDNAADFAAAAPGPESSATTDPSCTQAPPVDDPETIEQVQAVGHLSPLAGRPVNDVEGVVTAVGRNGFWLQSTAPDDDAATSAGIFVFTSAAPRVSVGDQAQVDGVVQEFRPGGSSSANLATTEITGPTSTVLSSGNPLPAPVVIGVDRVAPQQTIEAGDPGDVEASSTAYRPVTDAIDFYESLEGMRVAVRDAQVVGPTSDFGELPVVPGQAVDALRSPRGGVVYAGYDRPNAMRVQLDDALLPIGAMPAADVGDRLAGDSVGVLDYSFGNFKLELTGAPTLVRGDIKREVATRTHADEISLATFNVENLSPADDPSKFARLAAQVVGNLRAPDVLALEEVQDDNGPVNDALVDSSATVSRLTAAITAAGGPSYQARWVDPVDDADGGQPGGNIRQVFLYRTDRGVGFVDRPGGTATTATAVEGSGAATRLSVSPGRIDPASAAWTSSRKPLVGEFTWAGRTLFLIANHFASKGGDQPLFGRFQQPERSSEVQRHQQAQEVREFVDQLQAADPTARVAVLGDVNDFEFSRTTSILVGGTGPTALVDLPRTVQPDRRYTYVFEGNSQVLDHILLSKSLAYVDRDGGGPLPRQRSFVYDIVHTNAEFADQVSDHDPQTVRLRASAR